ncbi:MAG: TMEM175 family protein [Ignavibacteriales bacterium]|nr:TMEM175 family protein [Ignavibacteriales bacterium]
MATSNGFNTFRIENLTDGVYAIAMTILILGIKVPVGLDSSNETKIFFARIFIPLMIYLLSFLILGTYWVGTHIQHHFTAKTDRILLWINILLLMIISVIPFSASLLNNYTDDKVSIIFYSINLLSASLCHLLMLYYSRKKKFLKPHVTSVVFNSVRTRILLPTFFYLLAIPVSFLVPKYAVLLFFIPLVFDLIPGQVDKEIEQ